MATHANFRFGSCLCCAPTGGRRAFLAGATAAALAAPRILRAQGAPPTVAAVAQKQIVDVHYHFVPPAYVQGAGNELASGLAYPPYKNWTVQSALEQMDANGVGTAVLSISTPGVWFGDNAQGRRLARICNDYAAQMRHDHPGRFGLFAAVPLPDTEGSLAEIAYAFDTLKAEGIGLLTSYKERYVGDDSFFPVLEELNRRHATVFLHPNDPMCCGQIKDFVPSAMIEYPTDTTRAFLSLLYNGALTKFPDINWIVCHSGGTIPMLMGRFMALGRAPAESKRVPVETIPAAVRRLYFDTANGFTKPAMAAMMAVADPTHIMFGTDYPYVPVGANEGGLLQLGLAPEQLQAIFRDNALRLMPGLKAA